MHTLVNYQSKRATVSQQWNRLYIVIVICSYAMILFTAACQLEKRQEIPLINIQPELVSLPDRDYHFAVWVDDHSLAVTYPINSANMSGSIEEQLAVVDIDTGELQSVDLTKPEPDRCNGGHLLRLNRLQTYQVGLVMECYFSEPGKIFEDYIIAWNFATETQSLLYKYPAGFRASDFALSPDLSEMLQEREGDGINNTLYRVNLQGDFEQVLTDYYRVGSPDWKRDGSQVAFAATQQEPKERSNPFAGSVAIDNALSQPWTIYIANPDLSAQQVLVDNVYGVRALRWSPDGRFIGFNASNFQGKEGVFIATLNDHHVIQVWPKDTDFDWSPDGTKMVIMATDDSSGFSKPAILNISDLVVRRSYRLGTEMHNYQ